MPCPYAMLTVYVNKRGGYTVDIRLLMTTIARSISSAVL
jgi:hypothetical protein